MEPEDVPAELVEIGVTAWRKSGRYFMAPCTRAILAAVLPTHERMVRGQVATEIRTEADRVDDGGPWGYGMDRAEEIARGDQ
ncbi:hypothetical protein GCM10009550_01880 [Actinocorallia libanotica]|uniref:Uncharacterized protein n=2 Tax=Actinocorallia libanotica TaxID=46162 RepID=A0ABN1Q131_9ACTN